MTATPTPTTDPGRPLALLRLVRCALADLPGIGPAGLPIPDALAVRVTVSAHRAGRVVGTLGALGLHVDQVGRHLAVTVDHGDDPVTMGATAAALDAIDLVRQLSVMGLWDVADRGPVQPDPGIVVIDGQAFSPATRALPAMADLWDALGDMAPMAAHDCHAAYDDAHDHACDLLGLTWCDGLLWVGNWNAPADDAPARADLRGTPGPLTGPNADARMAAGIATAQQLRDRFGRDAVTPCYWHVGHIDQPAQADGGGAGGFVTDGDMRLPDDHWSGDVRAVLASARADAPRSLGVGDLRLTVCGDGYEHTAVWVGTTAGPQLLGVASLAADQSLVAWRHDLTPAARSGVLVVASAGARLVTDAVFDPDPQAAPYAPAVVDAVHP